MIFASFLISKITYTAKPLVFQYMQLCEEWLWRPNSWFILEIFTLEVHYFAYHRHSKETIFDVFIVASDLLRIHAQNSVLDQLISVGMSDHSNLGWWIISLISGDFRDLGKIFIHVSFARVAGDVSYSKWNLWTWDQRLTCEQMIHILPPYEGAIEMNDMLVVTNLIHWCRVNYAPLKPTFSGVSRERQ